MESGEDAAAFGIELVFRLCVADACNGVAHHFLQVNGGSGVEFACQHHLSGGDKCFAGYLGVGVMRKDFVEDGIGNLVCHFVGMTFRYGF